MVEPTIRLIYKAVLLLQGNALFTQAKPLVHCALVIDEDSFGVHYPRVAAEFNRLAQLLQAMNRQAEAEPLMHRALAILEDSFQPGHP